MNIFLTIVGGIVFACFSFIVACCLSTIASKSLKWSIDRIYSSAIKETHIEVGRNLMSLSELFSESKDTSTALKLIGESLLNRGDVNPIQVREDWRVKRISAGNLRESK